MKNRSTFEGDGASLVVRIATLLLLVLMVFSLIFLSVPSTARAQRFFGPPTPPQVGSPSIPDSGAQSMYQGYFIKPWWEQGRVAYPPTPQQASPFNTPPWGVSSGDQMGY
jgi:hypothetical protein